MAVAAVFQVLDVSFFAVLRSSVFQAWNGRADFRAALQGAKVQRRRETQRKRNLCESLQIFAPLRSIRVWESLATLPFGVFALTAVFRFNHG